MYSHHLHFQNILLLFFFIGCVQMFAMAPAYWDLSSSDKVEDSQATDATSCLQLALRPAAR